MKEQFLEAYRSWCVLMLVSTVRSTITVVTYQASRTVTSGCTPAVSMRVMESANLTEAFSTSEPLRFENPTSDTVSKRLAKSSSNESLLYRRRTAVGPRWKATSFFNTVRRAILYMIVATHGGLIFPPGYPCGHEHDFGNEI